MKILLALVLSGFFCFVDSKTPKGKRINLALETVLKFDKHDLASDLKLINSLQTFLAKVKDAIKHPKPSFRRNSQNDQKLYDHIQNIIVLLIYLDDENLENAAKIALEEFKKYRYKGCKFFELMRNSKFRKIMTYDLEELVEVPAEELRSKLKKLFRALKSNSNEAQNLLLELMSSLYDDKGFLEVQNFTRNLRNYQTKSMHDYTELHKLLRYAIRHLIFDQYSKLKVNDRITIEDYLNEVLTPNIVTRRSSSRQNSPKRISKIKRRVSEDKTDADLIEYLNWRKALRRSKNRNGMIKKMDTSEESRKRKIGKTDDNKVEDYKAVINIGTFKKDRPSDNKISRSKKQGITPTVIQKLNNLVTKSLKKGPDRNIFDFLSRNAMKQRRANYDSILESSSEQGLAIESFELITTNLTCDYKNYKSKGNQSKSKEMVTLSTEIQDIQTTVTSVNHNDADFKRSTLAATDNKYESSLLTARKQNSTVGIAITYDPSFEKLQMSLSDLTTQKASTSLFFIGNVTKDFNENTIENGYPIHRQEEEDFVPTKRDINIMSEEKSIISNSDQINQEELSYYKNKHDGMEESNKTNKKKQYMTEKNISNMQNDLKIEAIKDAEKIEENKIALLEKRVETLKMEIEKVYEETERRFNHDLKQHLYDSDSKNVDSGPMKEIMVKIQNDTKEYGDEAYSKEGNVSRIQTKPAESGRRFNRGVKLHSNYSESQNVSSAPIKKTTAKSQNDTKEHGDEAESTEGDRPRIQRELEGPGRRFNRGVKLHSNDSESEIVDNAPVNGTTAKSHHDTKGPGNEAESTEDDDKNEDTVITKNAVEDKYNRNEKPDLTGYDNDGKNKQSKIVSRDKRYAKSVTKLGYDVTEDTETTTEVKHKQIDNVRSATKLNNYTEVDDSKDIGNEEAPGKLFNKVMGNVMIQSKLATNESGNAKSASKQEANDEKNEKNTSKFETKEKKCTTELIAKDIEDGKTTAKSAQKQNDYLELTTKLDSNDSYGKKMKTKLDSTNGYNENTPTNSNSKDVENINPELKGNDNYGENTQSKIEATHKHDAKLATELRYNESDDKETASKEDYKQNNNAKSTTKLDSRDIKQTSTEIEESRDVDNEKKTRKLVDEDKDNDSDNGELPTKLDGNNRDGEETIPKSDGTTLKNSNDEETTTKPDLPEELRDEFLEEPVINARPVPRTQDEIRAEDPFGDIFSENFTKTTLPTIAVFTDLSSSTKSLLEGDPLEDLYEESGLPL